MLQALALAFALAAPPVTLPAPTREIVLNENGRATVVIPRKGVHGWSTSSGGVFRVDRVQTDKDGKHTRVFIEGSAAGLGTLTLMCDGMHREMWLIRVR